MGSEGRVWGGGRTPFSPLLLPVRIGSVFLPVLILFCCCLPDIKCCGFEECTLELTWKRTLGIPEP
jgi:hypothetical protein